MRRPITRLIRYWFAWLMALVLVVSLGVWFFTRDTLPAVIRVGTAVEGGLYHEEGTRLAEALRRRTGHEVEVVETSGSDENRERLLAGELDVSLVQGGAVPLQGLAIVTPLHRDVVQVIVRKELLVENQNRPTAMRDLAGKRVIVGLPGSGMLKSALDVLGHYGLDQTAELHEVHFTALLDDPEEKYDAAVVTTGVENQDVRRVYATGRFALLPLDAMALAKRYRHFEFYEAPTNLWPPVPARPVSTVSTSALVVVQEEASSQLVEHLLGAIFEEDMRDHFSAMFSPTEARALAPGRLHPTTLSYHDPFGRYSALHTLVEGLAAGKELLFALGAAIYLLWDRWRYLKERESQKQIRQQKNRLDSYLDRTLDIERKQMHVDDPKKLQSYLDEVTDIKLQALNNLTHEDLRGDRTFSIFLMQCANLISKIQLKIMNSGRRE